MAIPRPKRNQKNNGSKLESTNYYLQFINAEYVHDAAKYNEKLEHMPPKKQEVVYVRLPIYQLTKINLQSDK